MILSVANSRPRNMQSVQVKDILPEPNANDINPDSLSKFLEDYYAYMNLDGNPSREIASITQNKDIDYATEKYLDEIELLIAKYTPQSQLIDRERLLKIINNYYTIRGTEEGTKLFFKLFYGEDISINYPRERMLNVSDGEGKYVNFSLKTITLDDGTTLDIKKYLNLEDNTDRRVYGQYEYNDESRLYENIGKTVPVEYSITKVGNTLKGSTVNTYAGHNTIMSGNGKILAVADRKGNVKTYSYNSTTSLWTQLGSTLTGQAATIRSITFTDTLSNPDTITLSSHGLNNGDEVSFTDIVGTSGLDVERVYYVVNKTTHTFKISHTPGATPTTFTGSGTANLVVYKRFGHAMAFDYTGTQLLISEPGYSDGSSSGRVVLYNYTSSNGWTVSKKGNSLEDSTVSQIFFGKISLGDDTAVFGHAVAMNSIGDSIAISSINHTGGVYLDYVDTYKYKNNPPIYKNVTLDASTDTVTLASHGFKTGDIVSFGTTTDASAPVVDKKYYVINVTADTFKVSAKIDSGQIETATAAGTIATNGNALVVITSSAITGGQKGVNVPVVAGDTPNMWAEKVRVALSNDSEIILKFEIRGELDQITLVRRSISSGLYAAFDATLNISLANGTCTGITPAPKSVDVKDGIPVNFVSSGTATLRTYYSSWQSHGVFPLDENNLRAVTFTAATDTIDLQNHGLNNGDTVVFNIVREVDGIVAKRLYYVVNKTTHTFKIANVSGGTALTFNNDGTGTLLPQNTGLGKILNLVNGESFGWSLSYSDTGSRLAISTPDASVEKFGKCGKIDVYEYSGDLDSKWELLGNRSLYGTKSSGEKYGTAATLSGDGNTLIGSAPYRAGTRRSGQINVGCVVSYSWRGQNWAPLGRTPLYGNYVESLFGYKVDTNFDGSRLVISAPGREISFGDADIDTYSYIHLYEFNKQKDSWIQSWSTIENKTYDLYLGYSLQFDSTGSRLIYGIPYDIDTDKAIRNGTTFTVSSFVNKPTYTNGSQTISYSAGRWKWTNNGSTQLANIGNEPYPWLATWPAGTLPVTAFQRVGSVSVYNINAIDNSFASDRTTKLGKIRQTINGVQRDDWAIYDIFSEDVIDGYRYSYLTPPSGGINYDYAYSTIEYVNINDESDFEASTTEPFVTTYYKAELQTITGTYSYDTDIITVVAKNHGYVAGSLLHLNFTSGDLVDKIFEVQSVASTTALNDTFIVANTTYNSSTVTFTDSSDTVNFVDHGFNNGTEISFSQINSTTGINTTTKYYVINSDVNSFQLSLLPGGTTITLTTDGTGTVIYNRQMGEGTVNLLVAPPTHPYEVVSWDPITTPLFDYDEPIVVTAAPDDIRWVVSNRKGFLSEDNKIQDSYFYQIHSYEIKSQLQAEDWKDEFKGFCHPSGYELFSILEIIDFSKNNWVDYIPYIYGNRDYIPPRIRDLISKKESSKLLPTGLYEILTTFGGQHTPRSQPGRGIERDILLLIFVRMLDDLGKTYTLRDDAGQIVYTRNMVRMLYAYLAFHIDSKYIRGTNAEDMKFLGDDLDDTDEVLYKNTGKTSVYSYNSGTKTWSQLGQNLLGQRGDNRTKTHKSARLLLNVTLASVTGSIISYDNGKSGFKSTLISNTSVNWSAVLGVNNLTVGSRLVIANESNKAHNGIYVITSDTTLTRATDFDSSTKIVGNSFVFITEGIYSNTIWMVSENISIIGSSHVQFLQYNNLFKIARLSVNTPLSTVNDNNATIVYNNGTNGVGSTLTSNIPLDWPKILMDPERNTLALIIGSRIMVANQTNPIHNGIYVITSDTTLTRATDFDSSTEINDANFIVISHGPYSGTIWVCDKLESAIGTSPIYLKQPAEFGDSFGYSVAMNATGTRVAAAMPYNDNDGDTNYNDDDDTDNDYRNDPANLPDLKANIGCVNVYEYNSDVNVQAWIRLGNPIIGETAGDLSGWSISMNDGGSRVVIGAPGSGTDHGHVRVYEYNSGTQTWVKLGQDIDGLAINDKSGSSVSINSAGTRIAVGAPYSDNGSSNVGSVKVYDYNVSTSLWIQVGDTLTGEAAEDNFGSSLSLNSTGNRLIIGAPKNGALDAGHARVYEYISSNWTQLGTNIDGVTATGQNLSWAKTINGNGIAIGLNDLTSGENFGWSVTINAAGDRVAIGAPYADFLSRPNRGYVRVYEYSSGAWNLLGQTLEGELAETTGGWSLSMNAAGSRLVLGSPNHGGGHTKVYDYDTITRRWNQLGNDIYGDSFPYKNGWSVDINSTGDRIVVGESGSNSRTEIIDGQSLGNGLLDHTPESYLQLTTGQMRSSILNLPTNITKIKTTKIVPTLP